MKKQPNKKLKNTSGKQGDTVMSKKGIVVETILPQKLKVEIERLNGDKWRIHYVETLPKETPKEHIETTLRLTKMMGFSIRKRKNTLSYTAEGGTPIAFGGILGELLAISKIGDLTLREMIALMGLALPMLKEMQQNKEAK